MALIVSLNSYRGDMVVQSQKVLLTTPIKATPDPMFTTVGTILNFLAWKPRPQDKQWIKSQVLKTELSHYNSNNSESYLPVNHDIKSNAIHFKQRAISLSSCISVIASKSARQARKCYYTIIGQLWWVSKPRLWSNLWLRFSKWENIV